MTHGPLAGRLRSLRDEVARAVTEEFLRRHPDWVERYGTAARERGVEDARFHVDFLAGALESGDVAAIERYARWTRRVLESRGIDRAFLDENLAQVGNHLAARLEPGDRPTLERYVRAARDAATKPDPEPADPGQLPEDVSLYLQAALVGDRKAALGIALERVGEGDDVPAVYDDLLQPAQYEVGRRWELNAISVAEEHTATAVTQYILSQLYGRIEVPEPFRGRAVVTGVEGELHQIGAHMVADVLESDGWNTRFLGTQMPHRDILGVIESHGPRIVGISATLLPNLPAVRALIDAIRERTPERTRILVGGGAFRSRADFWTEIGADGYGRDLREAVHAARSLGGEA